MEEREKEGRKERRKEKKKLKHLRTGWMGPREFLHLSKQQNSLLHEELCGSFSVKDLHVLSL